MDYPDIRKRDTLVDAIRSIKVLGGDSRSIGQAADGTWEPDRYIETLGDFASDHAIGAAVDAMLDRHLGVNGLDCIIVAQSRERVTFLCADGEERTYLFTPAPVFSRP